MANTEDHTGIQIGPDALIEIRGNTVKFPDGTSMTIAGESNDEVGRKAIRFNQPPGTKDPVSPNALTQGFTENTANGLLGIPEVFAQLASNRMAGKPEPFSTNLLGMPTGREALASVESSTAPKVKNLFRGDVGEVFDQAKAKNIAGRNQLEKDHPMQQFIGEAASDFAMLSLGRSPFLKHTKAAKSGPSGKLDDNVQRGINELKGNDASPVDLIDAIKNFETRGKTTDILAPQIAKLMGKAGPELRDGLSKLVGRAAEGGLEGGALALLHGRGDVDPFDQAVFSAASQVGGYFGNKISVVDGVADFGKGQFLKGGMKMAAGAVAVGAILQTLKASTPGGKDFVLESLESGFDKIPIAIALGVLSGLTGAGRVGDADIPLTTMKMPVELMDALSSMPRAATIKIIRDLTADESGDTERLLQLTIEAPNTFTESQIKSLQRGLESGDFVQRARHFIDSNKKISDAVNAPAGLEGVPIKKNEK